MITPEYCRMMARYNAWQNRQLLQALERVPGNILREDQGAFFGSILGTLNHLVWGDRIWMSRFDPSVEKPSGGIPESADLFPTIAAWGSERFYLDGKITFWAQSLKSVHLLGSLDWYSGVVRAQISKPISACVAHMFNHQTHHRGQVHAMMTRAGLEAPVSDAIFMPEDA